MTMSLSTEPFVALAILIATIGAALAMGEATGNSQRQALAAVGEDALGPETLRDVPGGSVPWTLQEGEARLVDDEIEVTVRGLVVDRSGHPSDGTNPLTRFFVTVSCLDRTTGNVTNLQTATAPATPDGDAELQGTVGPPPSSRCVAPIVLVRGDLSSVHGDPLGNPEGPDPGDPWLAASASASP